MLIGRTKSFAVRMYADCVTAIRRVGGKEPSRQTCGYGKIGALYIVASTAASQDGLAYRASDGVVDFAPYAGCARGIEAAAGSTWHPGMLPFIPLYSHRVLKAVVAFQKYPEQMTEQRRGREVMKGPKKALFSPTSEKQRRTFPPLV